MLRVTALALHLRRMTPIPHDLKHCCRQLFRQEAEHIVSSASVKTEVGTIEALETSTREISEARSNPDAALVK
jgi:hypothetical protein